MKTVAVIMAGGKSSRMGRDKALLPLDGRPLLSALAHRWRGVFDGLVISADTRARFAALDLGGARIVEDTRPGAGPLAGLEAVMTAVPADRYFLTAVDLPFGEPALALELSERMGGADVCLIQREGRGWEPLFALYARRCLPAISAALDRGSAPSTAACSPLSPSRRCRRRPCLASSWTGSSSMSIHRRSGRSPSDFRPGQ